MTRAANDKFPWKLWFALLVPIWALGLLAKYVADAGGWFELGLFTGWVTCAVIIEWSER